MTENKTVAVYIDGYNLYYGRIRGTPYKWLDVVALARFLLNEHDPAACVDLVRYFTAPALATFATHGQASTEAQNNYHRALERQNPGVLAITLGKHSFDRKGTLIPRYVDGKAYDRNDRVRVWKLEEKQTDVNLALSMYRDVASGRFAQLVVCSNDSDAAPALQAIREDFPHIKLGVVMPRRPPVDGQREPRAASDSLSVHAHWVRRHLHDAELQAARLPDTIPTNKKPIRKPVHW